MAKKQIEKPVEKQEEVKPFDKANVISPLILFIIVVPQGQSSSVKKILDTFDVSAMFFANGEGTYSNETLEMMGLANKKNLIFTIIREDKAEAIKAKLKERFSVSKASAGVAICIRLTSIAGVSVYKFLSNTRKVTKVKENGR